MPNLELRLCHGVKVVIDDRSFEIDECPGIKHKYKHTTFDIAYQMKDRVFSGALHNNCS